MSGRAAARRRGSGAAWLALVLPRRRHGEFGSSAILNRTASGQRGFSTPLHPPPAHRSSDNIATPRRAPAPETRRSEANSLNNGGVRHFSESYGAALWTANFAFEAARAGVAGVNMHWGVGGCVWPRLPALPGPKSVWRRLRPSCSGLAFLCLASNKTELSKQNGTSTQHKPSYPKPPKNAAQGPPERRPRVHRRSDKL